MIQEVIIPKNYNPRAQSARQFASKYATPKNDNLHSSLVHKLEDFEYVMYSCEGGARQAMNKLQRDANMGEYSHFQNIETFITAKRYFIYSTQKHTSMTSLQDTMCRCNMERIFGKCVGCLVLDDCTYVFFWQKTV